MKDFPERSEGVVIPLYNISKEQFDKVKNMAIDIRKELAIAMSYDIFRNNPQLDVDVLIDEFLRRPPLGEYLREAMKREVGCMISKELIIEKIEQWEKW